MLSRVQSMLAALPFSSPTRRRSSVASSPVTRSSPPASAEDSSTSSIEKRSPILLRMSSSEDVSSSVAEDQSDLPSQAHDERASSSTTLVDAQRKSPSKRKMEGLQNETSGNQAAGSKRRRQQMEDEEQQQHTNKQHVVHQATESEQEDEISSQESIANDQEGESFTSSGRLPPSETERMDSLVHTFLKQHDLSRPSLMGGIHSRSPPSEAVESRQAVMKQFWDELFDAFPDRSQQSLVKTCRRRYHNFQARGRFCKQDDDELKDLYARFPNRWVIIAREMGRHPEDCRDRWRNYVSCGDRRKKSRWTVVESLELERVLKDLREKLEDDKKAIWEEYINWKDVSQGMDFKRSRLQCLSRWKVMKNQNGGTSEPTKYGNRVDSQRPKSKPASQSATPKRYASQRGRPNARTSKALNNIRNMLPGDKYWILFQIEAGRATNEKDIRWFDVAISAANPDGPITPWSALELRLAFEQMATAFSPDMSLSKVLAKLSDDLEMQFPDSLDSYYDEDINRQPESSAEPSAESSRDTDEAQHKPLDGVVEVIEEIVDLESISDIDDDRTSVELQPLSRGPLTDQENNSRSHDLDDDVVASSQDDNELNDRFSPELGADNYGDPDEIESIISESEDDQQHARAGNSNARSEEQASRGSSVSQGYGSVADNLSEVDVKEEYDDENILDNSLKSKDANSDHEEEPNRSTRDNALKHTQITVNGLSGHESESDIEPEADDDDYDSDEYDNEVSLAGSEREGQLDADGFASATSDSDFDAGSGFESDLEAAVEDEIRLPAQYINEEDSDEEFALPPMFQSLHDYSPSSENSTSSPRGPSVASDDGTSY